MENITDNKILAEAELYRINEDDSVAYHAFIQGAKWMREESKQSWIKWGEEGSNDITHNSLLLFDNGHICRYCEDWPFATVEYFLLVPEIPKPHPG